MDIKVKINVQIKYDVEQCNYNRAVVMHLLI